MLENLLGERNRFTNRNEPHTFFVEDVSPVLQIRMNETEFPTRLSSPVDGLCSLEKNEMKIPLVKIVS